MSFNFYQQWTYFHENGAAYNNVCMCTFTSYCVNGQLNCARVKKSNHSHMETKHIYGNKSLFVFINYNIAQNLVGKNFAVNHSL